METRARYALIGLFTLAVIVVGFAFVYWLNGAGGLRQYAPYRIRFETPVAGLLKGSAVLFNGIRVGEVTRLDLSADNPKQVIVSVAVAPATPVRTDTRVEIDFQGLTGAPVVSLTGGGASARPLTATGAEPPLLVADAAATQSLTQAARATLHRLDEILDANAEPLKSAIGNINTFSAALARNADRLDGIVAGLERFTGGGTKGPLTTYDLTAPRVFPPLEKVAQIQLAVPDPTSPITLDNQKILPPPDTADTSGFANAQWSDTIPKLFQAKIVEALENSNYLSAVSRPLDSGAGGTAEVEFSGKLLGGGRIVAARVFAAKAAAEAAGAPAAIAAVNEAFGKAVTELVVWAGEALQTAPAPKRH
jgi:phospholipid/cholesterol/gamma-HCH transport system substrate-binding protein